jgi:hypothetical protein
MRPLRRLAAASALGFHRARVGGARAAVVVLGVAAATALLAGVLLGATTAERRTLERSVERLPAEARTIRAAWFGIPAQAEPLERLDGAARAALARVVTRPATSTVLFRESTVGGAFVALGAVDDLDEWVRLSSGRLPRSCRPGRCEVVQLRGDGSLPRGFAVVGRGRLRTTALFGDAIPAERSGVERAQLAPTLERTERYHRPAAPPLLLADGVAELSALPALASSYRSYGWVAPLQPGDVVPWRLDALLGDVARARVALHSSSVGFELVAPAAELRAAGDRARVGARRLLLLGGQGAALLLAFAAFAATRLRRPARDADHRLALLGVPLWQRAVAIGVHAATLALLGAVAVWLSAGAATAIVDPGLARSALLSADAIAAALVLAVVAGAVFVAALAMRPGTPTARLGALDLVAAMLLVAIAAALARGAADADALLRGGGTGIVLLVLPAAVVAIAALAAARLLAPVVRLVERALPRDAIGVRLAALSLARRPGAGASAAAFLVASIGLAIFASSYRATLVQGQREQAAFALGADFVLREDLRRLVPVREIATDERLAALGDEVDAAPVTRVSANVPSVGRLTGVTVLGLEPSLLRSLRGSDVAVPDLRVPADLTGPALPVEAKSLELAGRSSDPNVSLGAVVRRPDGEYEELPLTLPGRVGVPRRARGGTFLGFRVLPPPRLQERGADAGRAVVAQLRLGPLAAGGTVVVDGYEGWIGRGGASFDRGTLSVTLSEQVDTWFRPRQPLDGVPLPALTSAALAAVADDTRRLTLQIGGRRVDVRVAAVARRFPATRGDFAVVDRTALEAALDLEAPGSGFPTEVWGNSASAAVDGAVLERLRRPPFDQLVLDSRREREEELRADPVARGALAMLVVASGAALLLALLALALATLSDVRDDRRELLELETQGATPALLRRILRLRQLAVALVGLVGGVAAGAVLAALVVDVVSVSASATPPVPPLRLELAPLAVAAALSVVAALAVTFVLATTRRAFAGPDAPGRLEVDA